MVTPAEIEYLDKFIFIQKRNIRYYLLYSLGLVMLGLAIIGVGFFFFPIEYLKLAFSLGGVFISSVGGYRLIKDILICRNRIDTYKSMKDNWSQLRSDADKERFREMVWKVLEKSAVG